MCLGESEGDGQEGVGWQAGLSEVCWRRWGDLEFPLPFGRSMTSAEEHVHELDGKTGASLKLSILNPKGRIWTMVAGGGASVIYAGMRPSGHDSPR